MSDAVSAAVLVVSAAGLVSAGLALLSTRRPVVAIAVLLDMLLAASLLRLALDPTPSQLLGTALLVLVKRLASAGLHRASAARGSRTAST